MGDDEWGTKYLENLKNLNVNTEYVGIASGKNTGLAQINVAESGENQIVIVPGANDTIAPADVENVQDVLDASKVFSYLSLYVLSLQCMLSFNPINCRTFGLSQILVCQLETPRQATLTALRRFKNGISILNAAPAPSENSLELFTLPTILCINQVEAAAMSKRPVPNIE